MQNSLFIVRKYIEKLHHHQKAECSTSSSLLAQDFILPRVASTLRQTSCSEILSSSTFVLITGFSEACIPKVASTLRQASCSEILISSTCASESADVLDSSPDDTDSQNTGAKLCYNHDTDFDLFVADLSVQSVDVEHRLIGKFHLPSEIHNLPTYSYDTILGQLVCKDPESCDQEFRLPIAGNESAIRKTLQFYNMLEGSVYDRGKYRCYFSSILPGPSVV